MIVFRAADDPILIRAMIMRIVSENIMAFSGMGVPKVVTYPKLVQKRDPSDERRARTDLAEPGRERKGLISAQGPCLTRSGSESVQRCTDAEDERDARHSNGRCFATCTRQKDLNYLSQRKASIECLIINRNHLHP